MNRITPLASAVPVTMSSREIADLTGKQHQHIKRDIESMLADLGKDASSFGRIYQDILNRQQTEYALPKRECLILVSGYDVVMRARIIDRWLELEARITLPTAPSLPVLESSLVLACNGIPIRFLIDETGEWQATYKDVATVLAAAKSGGYDCGQVLNTLTQAALRSVIAAFLFLSHWFAPMGEASDREADGPTCVGCSTSPTYALNSVEKVSTRSIPA